MWIILFVVLFCKKILFTWILSEFFKLDHVLLINFSLFPITYLTPSNLEYFSGLICGAQPVTIIFFFGNSFFDLRIAYSTFFSASCVTVQELIIVKWDNSLLDTSDPVKIRYWLFKNLNNFVDYMWILI